MRVNRWNFQRVSSYILVFGVALIVLWIILSRFNENTSSLLICGIVFIYIHAFFAHGFRERAFLTSAVWMFVVSLIILWDFYHTGKWVDYYRATLALSSFNGLVGKVIKEYNLRCFSSRLTVATFLEGISIATLPLILVGGKYHSISDIALFIFIVMFLASLSVRVYTRISEISPIVHRVFMFFIMTIFLLPFLMVTGFVSNRWLLLVSISYDCIPPVAIITLYYMIFRSKHRLPVLFGLVKRCNGRLIENIKIELSRGEFMIARGTYFSAYFFLGVVPEEKYMAIAFERGIFVVENINYILRNVVIVGPTPSIRKILGGAISLGGKEIRFNFTLVKNHYSPLTNPLFICFRKAATMLERNRTRLRCLIGRKLWFSPENAVSLVERSIAMLSEKISFLFHPSGAEYIMIGDNIMFESRGLYINVRKDYIYIRIKKYMFLLSNSISVASFPLELESWVERWFISSWKTVIFVDKKGITNRISNKAMAHALRETVRNLLANMEYSYAGPEFEFLVLQLQNILNNFAKAIYSQRS